MFNSFLKPLASILFILGTCSFAYGEKINVSLIELSGALENTDTGWAAELNKEVLARVTKASKYTFVVSSYPGKRAIQNLRNKNSTLLFPTVLGSLQDKANSTFYYPDSIDSVKLMNSEYVAYTLKGNPTFDHLSDLKGKKVGILSGANLPTEFNNTGATYEGTETLRQNFLKLTFGRIDCVIALKVLGDTFLAKEKKISGVVSSSPLLNVFGGYSAQNTPQGQELIKLINEATQSMVKDGTYKRIMGSTGSAAY